MTAEEARQEIKKLQEKQWDTAQEYAKAASNVVYRFLRSNREFVARKCAEKIAQDLVDFRDIPFGETKQFRSEFESQLAREE